MVIAYLMWTHGWDFQRAFAHTKERRAVASPNAGFICCLIELGLRFAQLRDGAPLAPRLFRMVPWFHEPMAKLIESAEEAAPVPKQLDARSCFVLQSSEGLHVWVGSCSHAAYRTAAEAWAQLLCRFEGTPAPQLELQGAESEAFWAVLGGRAPVPAACLEYNDDYGAGKAPSREPPQRHTSLAPSVLSILHSGAKTPRGAATSCLAIAPEPLSPKKAHVEGVAELYALPNIDPLSMFDSDDLMPDGLYVLLVRSGSGDLDHARVWVGEEVEREPKHCAAQARELLARLGTTEGLPLSLVMQGKEDESFWAHFVNG